MYVTEYKETHQTGAISIETMPGKLKSGRHMKGDFGIQVARDGRVWICIDGAAFLRFSPHPNGKMAATSRFGHKS